MHKLTDKNLKKYLKNPRYLTLCKCKHEDKLLRLDLFFKGGSIYHFSFNDILTGKTFTGSENLEVVIKTLDETGYEVMFFDSATEYYQYIIDFIS
jgi:hypothetical protein